MELQKHPDQPEWLSHVNASVLKIKLAMAIIGISSIHLLRVFIYAGQLGKETSQYTVEGVKWQAIIHVIFILSAIGIAYVEKISQDAYAAGKRHMGDVAMHPAIRSLLVGCRCSRLLAGAGRHALTRRSTVPAIAMAGRAEARRVARDVRRGDARARARPDAA